MIKSDLVRRVAGKNPHLHVKDAQRIVDAVLDEVGAALARRDRVEARGFGVFTVRLQSARPGRTIRRTARPSVFRRNSILTFGHQKPCTVGSIERRDHEGEAVNREAEIPY
jgi:integration host factor subunit beta